MRKFTQTGHSKSPFHVSRFTFHLSPLSSLLSPLSSHLSPLTSINLPQPQKRHHLINLLRAHFFCCRMVVGIKADQGRSVVVIDLYFREIGYTIFSFCKNAMAAAAMQFVQYFTFFAFLQQQLPVYFGNMARDIVLSFLFCYTLLQKQAGCQQS